MKSFVISAYDEAYPCGKHKMRHTVICGVCVRVRTASHLSSMVSETSVLRLVIWLPAMSQGWWQWESCCPSKQPPSDPGAALGPAVPSLCFSSVAVHPLAEAGQRTSLSSSSINSIMEVMVGGNFVCVVADCLCTEGAYVLDWKSVVCVCVHDRMHTEMFGSLPGIIKTQGGYILQKGA